MNTAVDTFRDTLSSLRANVCPVGMYMKVIPALLVLCALTTTLACSHDTALTAPTPAPTTQTVVSFGPTLTLPNGWIGHTSQGLAVGFVFNGTHVTTFALSVNGTTADCATFFGSFGFSGSSLATITDTGFSFTTTSPVIARGSTYSFTVTGTFTSDSTASGTIVGAITDLPTVSKCSTVPVDVTWTVTKPS